jgi:phage/plasmid-like protein (TIGR03299 family)
MGHEIDTTNGQSSFADSRADARNPLLVDAWHKLGTAVGHTMTVDEALDAAHMRDWDVRKIPLVADISEIDNSEGRGPTLRTPDQLKRVPKRYLTVRSNPITGDTEPLGVVGERWTPFQNEATTALLSDITKASGGHIETLGGLDGGRRTFVTMKMPNWMEFTSPKTGAADITDLYLSVFNWHDGCGALVAQISPVRVVCANTQRVAESLAISKVALRHTGDPRNRLAEVRNLLGLTFAYRETFVELNEQLISKTISTVQVLDVMEDVWNVAGATTERQEKLRKNSAAEVLGTYAGSLTVAPFYGTAFGAYNAVTEYLDHLMPVKGTSDDEEAAIKRAHRTLTSDGMGQIKARAFSALLSV